MRTALLLAIFLLLSTTATANSPPFKPVVTVTPTPTHWTDDIYCETSTTDPDGDTITYNYKYYKNGNLWTNFNTTQTQRLMLRKNPNNTANTYKCEVTPSDGTLQGESAFAETTVYNNQPTGLQVDVTPDVAHWSDDLYCGVSSIDPDGDQITYTYQYYKNGTRWTTFSTTQTQRLMLRKNPNNTDNTYTCEVRAFDASGGMQTATDSVTVGNQPPSAPTVRIIPEQPHWTDDLYCNVKSVDPDGDQITYNYTYYKNGNQWTTFNTTQTQKLMLRKNPNNTGNTYTCEVTPRDASQSGPTGSFSTTPVANFPPEITSVKITPGAPLWTDDLYCSVNAVDKDGDQITYTYTYYKNGNQWTTFNTTQTQKLMHRKNPNNTGNTYTCEITPKDASDTGATVSDEVLVGNCIPSKPLVRVSTLPSHWTDDLYCEVDSTDEDGDQITYTYQYYKNGNQWTTFNTTQTQKLMLRKNPNNTGNEYVCKVTPRDASQTGQTNSSLSPPVENAPPTKAEVWITPKPAHWTDDLYCNVKSVDPDGDQITYTYQYYKNGTRWTTFSTTQTQRLMLRKNPNNTDNTYTCQVTPRDASNVGEGSSAEVTVFENAPSKPIVRIMPEKPHWGDDLYCEVSSVDPDGDQITYTYQYYKNGTRWTTFSTTQTQRLMLRKNPNNTDNTYKCEVRPFSPALPSGSFAAEVTVENRVPQDTRVLITPNPATASDDLYCAVSSTDLDGDQITYNYTYYKNGNPWTTFNTTQTQRLMLRKNPNNTDNTYTCQVTPQDASGTGAAVAAEVTVGSGSTTCSTDGDCAAETCTMVSDYCDQLNQHVRKSTCTAGYCQGNACATAEYEKEEVIGQCPGFCTSDADCGDTVCEDIGLFCAGDNTLTQRHECTIPFCLQGRCEERKYRSVSKTDCGVALDFINYCDPEGDVRRTAHEGFCNAATAACETKERDEPYQLCEVGTYHGKWSGYVCTAASERTRKREVLTRWCEETTASCQSNVAVEVEQIDTGEECRCGTFPDLLPPVAAFSADPATGVAPLEVQFDGTFSSDPDGYIEKYKWDFESDGTFDANGDKNSFTYPSPGDYNATLKVTDNNGLTDSAIQTITATPPVNQAPVASFTAVPRQGVPELIVDFDASASSDPDGDALVLYEWDFDDGTQISEADAKTAHTFSLVQAYSVTLRVKDERDAWSEPVTRQVNVVGPVSIIEVQLQNPQLAQPLAGEVKCTKNVDVYIKVIDKDSKVRVAEQVYSCNQPFLLAAISQPGTYAVVAEIKGLDCSRCNVREWFALTQTGLAFEVDDHSLLLLLPLWLIVLWATRQRVLTRQRWRQ